MCNITILKTIEIAINKNGDFKIIEDGKTFIRTLDYGKDSNIRTNLLKVNGYINGEKAELTLIPFNLRGNRNSKSQCMVIWIKEE